jgi:hypothetical protein
MLLGYFLLDAPSLLDIFFRNDSAWYALIVANGYPAHAPDGLEQTVFSFFPLYPALLSFFTLTGISFNLAAVVFSLIGSLLFCHLVFIWLGRHGWSDRTIFRFLVVYQLLPFHHFVHMFYTEQLFVLLFAWLLLAYENKKHLQVLVAAFLITLSRPTGLIYCAALPLLYLPSLSTFDKKTIYAHFLRALPLAGAPLALASWMIYLYFHTGDALAFSHSQIAWDRKYTWPWMSLFNNSDPYIALLSSWAILFIVIAFYLLRKRNVWHHIFHGINLLFPLITGQVISYPRYVSVNLELFSNLQGYLTGKYFILIVLTTAMLHFLVFIGWLYNVPVLSY